MNNISYVCAEACEGLDSFGVGVTWWAYIIPLVIVGVALYIMFKMFERRKKWVV